MKPLFEIQNGLGMEENSLKVFPNRILIQKPKITTAHTPMDFVKKELRLRGIGCEYIGIDVPFSHIESIFYKAATGTIIKNGLIVFYLKGREKNEVNFLNYNKTVNAIKFWSQDNKTALAIKEYVERNM